MILICNVFYKLLISNLHEIQKMFTYNACNVNKAKYVLVNFLKI